MHEHSNERDKPNEQFTPAAARHAVGIIDCYNWAYTSAEGSHVFGKGINYDDKLNLIPPGEALGDSRAIRIELINTYLPVLNAMGLELATPTDLGRDDRGQRLTADPNKALPLAIAVNDSARFLQTLDMLSSNNRLSDTDTRDANSFVNEVCKGTARIVRGEYDSSDHKATAHAERLLLTISEVVPVLKERGYKQIPYLKGRGDHLTTLETYVKCYEEGTLEDYLGAEKRDIVTQEAYTYGPSQWGGEVLFKPLYTPAEFSEKWRTALEYMKELQDKRSPLFDELFANLRNEFEESFSWLHEKPNQTDEEEEKAAILREMESIWSTDFQEAGGIYQLDKAVEATALAQHALAYGQESSEIPELSPDADEISMTAAQGLIREQVRYLVEIGEALSNPVSDSKYEIRKDEENMRHTLNYLGEGHVLYRKAKLTNILGTPQFQLELRASPDGQNVIIEKEISYQADSVEGKGIRLQAIVDTNGIRARLRNLHMAGQTHYNHWLTAAESIQVASAMITQLEKEAALFAK